MLGGVPQPEDAATRKHLMTPPPFPQQHRHDQAKMALETHTRAPHGSQEKRANRLPGARGAQPAPGGKSGGARDSPARSHVLPAPSGSAAASWGGSWGTAGAQPPCAAPRACSTAKAQGEPLRGLGPFLLGGPRQRGPCSALTTLPSPRPPPRGAPGTGPGAPRGAATAGLPAVQSAPASHPTGDAPGQWAPSGGPRGAEPLLFPLGPCPCLAEREVSHSLHRLQPEPGPHPPGSSPLCQPLLWQGLQGGAWVLGGLPIPGVPVLLQRTGAQGLGG